MRCSHRYKSRAWGFDAEEEFSNQVLEVDTDLMPEQLLDALQAIERELGRDREAEQSLKQRTGARYTSRPIDIDILFYDDRVIRTDAPAPVWLNDDPYAAELSGADLTDHIMEQADVAFAGVPVDDASWKSARAPPPQTVSPILNNRPAARAANRTRATSPRSTRTAGSMRPSRPRRPSHCPNG